MQREAVKFLALILVFSMLAGSVAASPGSPLAPSGASQYCNEKYKYCVDLPPSGKAEAHQGDAPNHGVTIVLPDSGQLWTYAEWDAALFEEAQKAALERREIILRKHPDAAVTTTRAVLAGLSAYRMRFTYVDSQPMTEEIIIAYRKPKDQSKDTGIIYELGMKCTPSACKANVGVFGSFISTFQQVEK